MPIFKCNSIRVHYQFFKSFPWFFGLRFQCSGISCFVSYYWHLKSGTRNPIARFQHNYKARNLSNNSLNFKILVQTKSDTIQISATDLQFVPFINIILQKQNIKIVQTRWSITGVIRTSSDLSDISKVFEVDDILGIPQAIKGFDKLDFVTHS